MHQMIEPVGMATLFQVLCLHTEPVLIKRFNIFVLITVIEYFLFTNIIYSWGIPIPFSNYKNSYTPRTNAPNDGTGRSGYSIPGFMSTDWTCPKWYKQKSYAPTAQIKLTVCDKRATAATMRILAALITHTFLGDFQNWKLSLFCAN